MCPGDVPRCLCANTRKFRRCVKELSLFGCACNFSYSYLCADMLRYVAEETAFVNVPQKFPGVPKTYCGANVQKMCPCANVLRRRTCC